MRASFIVTEVLTGLRRNITMTVAMIITTAISLGLFGAGLVVVQMTNKTEQIYLDRVQVEVFLNNDVSSNDPNCQQATCLALRNDLQNTAGVQSVDYVNRAQAYQIYKRSFANTPELIKLVRPQALPASFKVKLSDPNRFGVISDQFSHRPGVQSVRNQQELVQRLFSVLKGVRNGAFAIAIVQAVGALFLIANMIQIAAYTRRQEVGIMRLVGASRWYTQLPFLLEAVFAALIGGLLAIGGLFTAKSVFLDNVLSDVYKANIIAKITDSDVLLVSPFLLILGGVLAAVTGYITLRLYVRH